MTMRDYAVMIKALRWCDDVGKCSECPEDFDCAEKNGSVMREAADAIEELLAKVRSVVHCKDCEFGEHSTDGNGNHCVLCGNSMVFDYPYAHDPDWFCADGEMKGADGSE